MDRTSTQAASFPTLRILGIVFITLKLTDHIDWSWWWVLSPFWMPWVVIFGLVAGFGVVWLIVRGLGVLARAVR